MIGDGFGVEAKGVGDLPHGLPLREQPQHLEFAGGQRIARPLIRGRMPQRQILGQRRT